MSQDAAASPFVPPGPNPDSHKAGVLHLFLLGMLRPLDAWPRQVFEEPIYRAPVPGRPIFLMDPEAIGDVFVDHADCFTRGELVRRLMRPAWGKGMPACADQEWRWQRRATAPVFRPRHVRTLVPFMSRVAEAALERWGSEAEVDFAEETARMSFDVILDTVLSGGEGVDRAAARANIANFRAKVLSPRASFFLAPDSWHEGRSLPAPGAANLLAEVEAMLQRRRGAPPRGDLVDLLFAAQDPVSGQSMDDEILRDNIRGFVISSHQTSAFALSWSVYLASAHEPTAARLRSEVEAVAGDAPIGPEHLEKLVFTRQVVSEALRLYPPTFQIYRICLRDTTIGTHRVRAGEKVLIPIYALHRHRRWWRDPDVFDPDRFAPGAAAPDRHLYMPFGAGGRICLGAAFAMTELVTMLATLMRGATFRVDPSHRVWPGTGMEMAPRGGLPMRIEARAKTHRAAPAAAPVG